MIESQGASAMRPFSLNKVITLVCLFGFGLAVGSVQGFDVSSYQPNVDFRQAFSDGARFVIIKATEGTSYVSPAFSEQYTEATNTGFVRGGYHFSSFGNGAKEANYFLAHGGGWSDDGITLPGMLDLEGTCPGSVASVLDYIRSFVDTYHSKTGRYPILYTSTSWWEQCTGNSKSFSDNCPLMLASWGSSPGAAPGGWSYQTIWQNADSYSAGGDSDVFNGDLTQLKKLAKG